MYQAIEQIKAKSEARGEARGEAKGRMETLRGFIKLELSRNNSVSSIVQDLVNVFLMPQEEATRLVQSQME